MQDINGYADTLFLTESLSVRRMRDNSDDRALLLNWLNDPNGVTTAACDKITCGELHAYSYTDPDHGDNPPGARAQQCEKWAKENEK